MNDFTKDELIGLFYILSTFMRYCEGGGKTVNLLDKVKKLIDNYNCDHNFKLCKTFHGVEESAYRCTKCLKAMEKSNE